MSKKSFFYGLLIASILWAIFLYSYLNLLQTLEDPTNEPYAQPKLHYGKDAIMKGNSIGRILSNDIEFSDDSKTKYKYVNSKKLINHLQPVAPKASNSIDQNLDALGMVRNHEDKRKRDEGYKNYAFNTLISEAIGYSRNIPDTRHKLCQNQTFAKGLPSASVVICFYNEHLITLLRTVHSVLERTAKSLLHEIILVDDYSDLITLHSDVERYISQNLDEKVKLLKTDRREGLIRARLFGADKASGDVIVFLDSHVEVNKNWLEPLVSRIFQSRKIVAVPVIDIINADSFSYSSSPLVRGGFNWGLHFKWDNLPKGTLSTDKDFIQPIKSPTMAGGLFAMERKYFYELGAYDSGMDVWGGENIEISFRIWMCGGSLEIVPCSRVGHVFRRRRPYGNINGVDTMVHNSLRVASVWMDEYKEYFLEQRPEAAKIYYGDVSDRIALRKKLNCKTFEWYLKEVYPELVLPTDNEERLKKKWSALEQNKFQPWHMRKRNYIDQYSIRLANTSLCIAAVKDVKSKGSALALHKCSNIKKQQWFETDKNELVLGQLLCLEADDKSPRIMKCHEMGGNQEWRHNGKDQGPIYNMALGLCLGAKSVEENSTIKMVLCSSSTGTQWTFVR